MIPPIANTAKTKQLNLINQIINQYYYEILKLKINQQKKINKKINKKIKKKLKNCEEINQNVFESASSLGLLEFKGTLFFFNGELLISFLVAFDSAIEESDGDG